MAFVQIALPKTATVDPKAGWPESRLTRKQNGWKVVGVARRKSAARTATNQAWIHDYNHTDPQRYRKARHPPNA